MRRCLYCHNSLEGTHQQRRRCQVCSLIRRHRLEEARAAARRSGRTWVRHRFGLVRDDLSGAEIDALFQQELAKVKREKRFTVDPWASRGISYEPS